MSNNHTNHTSDARGRAYEEEIAEQFRAEGWTVVNVRDAVTPNDLQQAAAILAEAKGIPLDSLIERHIWTDEEKILFTQLLLRRIQREKRLARRDTEVALPHGLMHVPDDELVAWTREQLEQMAR